MGSHHGTHLRKPGETVSRILKPETPTQLADGDVLTFGKSVGKNNKCVRPVVARVQLTHAPRPEPSFKPITSIVAHHIDLTKSPPPRRSNSGRFGVYVPASFSDQEEEESSHDSDIEELPFSFPASGPNALPLKSHNNSNLEVSDSHLNHNYEVLRHLFTPAHVPGAPAGDEGRRNVANHDSLDQGSYSPPYCLSSPVSPCLSPISPRYSPTSPSRFSPAWSIGESSFFGHHVWESRSDSDAASSAPELPEVSPRSPIWDPTIDEDEPPRRTPLSLSRENSLGPDPQRHASRSRSTSPMELASPSPVISPLQVLPREEPIVAKEPSLLRATSTPPIAEAKSLPSATEEVPVDVELAASQEPSMAAAKAMSLDAICSPEPLSPAHECQDEQPSKDETPSKPPAAQITTDGDVEQTPAPAASGIITKTFAEESEVVALKTSLEKLQVNTSFVPPTSIDLNIPIPFFLG